MEYVLIKMDSPEWNEMWDWVAVHPINKDINMPSFAINGSEAWQYTGSVMQKGIVISSFRHRKHPTTNNLQTLAYKHKEVKTESIIRKIKP
jgi:hypothetical protein